MEWCIECMKWKKFAGPAILAGIAILIYVAVNILGSMKYEEGDTVDVGLTRIFLCMGLMSVLMCLSSIVWFAFALGTKTQKTVILVQNPDDFQHTSVPLTSDSQSTVVPSAVGGGPVSYVREKIIIAKSEDDTAQMVGFLLIVGSVVMFVLMIISGFIWAFSDGEVLGSVAKFSMWASLLLFPCGLITLSRPWSWFRSGEDIHDPVVKVRAGIVAGIALIAVISFGWPALIVVGIALSIYAAAGWVKE